MSQIDPNVLRRLKALLNLANDGRGNEAEAQLAMERAQELMLQHNLTTATLEAAGQQGEGRLKDRTTKNLMFKWQRELFTTIAEVNFCYFSLVYKRTAAGEQIAGGYEIIGRQSNVVGARNMYEYLSETIARLVKLECGTSAPAQFTKYANSFRLGCVHRLAERLRERHRTKLEEQSRQAREANAATRHPSSTLNALVVVLEDFAQRERDENNDVLYGLEIGTTARRRQERDLEFHQREQEQEARRQALIAEGVNPEVAYYMSIGYSRERAEEIANPPPAKPETAAQRRKRERQEARQEARWHARQRREERKIDVRGYMAGERSGDTVGLDDQIDRTERKKLSQG